MSVQRDRFDETEERLLKDALSTNNLWPYRGSEFAPYMKQAASMVEKHFSTSDRDAFMVPTSSGTSSIQVALGGLKIPPGSEVIVSPLTDPGSVTPILFHNTIPVFADVSPTSGLVTPDTVAAALTRRTSAVIAVHLTGSPVDVPGIRQRLEDLGRGDVKIIEDVAQGLGATLNNVPLGMMGDAGCFSLNSHKHITVGEGGFVLLHNEDDFYRSHNFSDKHRDRLGGGGKKPEHGRYQGPGQSLRMSELQGAMLEAQLPKLMEFAAARTAFGLTLGKRLAELSDIVPQEHLKGAVPTFFGLMFRTQNAVELNRKSVAIDEIESRLEHLGTSIGGSYTADDEPIYKYPLFQNRAFSTSHDGLWPAELVAAHYHNDIQLGHYDYTKVSCPQAENYLKRAFWVRVHEKYTTDHAVQIADTIVDVFDDLGLAERHASP